MIPEQSLLTGCVTMYVYLKMAKLSTSFSFHSHCCISSRPGRLSLRSSAALQTWKNFSHVERIDECVSNEWIASSLC